MSNNHSQNTSRQIKTGRSSFSSTALRTHQQNLVLNGISPLTRGRGTRTSPPRSSTAGKGSSSNKSSSNEDLKYHHKMQSSPDLPPLPQTSRPSISKSTDLRKEYARYCRLYSSEPLDIIGAPLEKLSYGTETKLDLKGRGLRGVDCIALGKLMATNSVVTHLFLSDCLLLPQGFEALLDGLSKNTTMRVLELRGNNIQTTMVDNLASFLRTNHSLKELLLEWNAIGSSLPHFEAFCSALEGNKGLEVVDLRNNQITDQLCESLSSVVRTNGTLRDLDLRWNSIGIQGAKLLWDAVGKQRKTKKALRKMELGGNYIPEEIVTHITSTLEERNEKDALVRDYTKRTDLLTTRLRKTEENYQEEIKSMVSVFGEEEAGLKAKIKSGIEEVGRLSQILLDERKAIRDLKEEMCNLENDLSTSKCKEDALLTTVQQKEEKIRELKEHLKAQAEELGASFREKIDKVSEDLKANTRQNDDLALQLKEAKALLKDKEDSISLLNSRIEALKASALKDEEAFKSRLQKEKENWANWKSEIESHEQRETELLQTQCASLHKEMNAHVKLLEGKKAEAEEEVNRLKMALLTSKTEAEEGLSHLRTQLQEEHGAASASLQAQVAQWKAYGEEQDGRVRNLDSNVRRVESEMATLRRSNEHLRQQNSALESEVSEAGAKGQADLVKAKKDLSSLSDALASEQEANKGLRSTVLELQESVAILTLKLKRVEKEGTSELEFLQGQLARRDEEVKRLKEEDMRRAALLHEAFSVYMRSTSAATGLPIPENSSSVSRKLPFSKDTRQQHQQHDYGAKGDSNNNNA